MDTVSFLNNYSNPFIRFSWIMLLQSSVLILILLGLDVLLRQKVRAVFRYCLWMLVLVKLVLPVGLALPCSPAYYASSLLPEKAVESPQSLPAIADTSPATVPAEESIPYQPNMETPAAAIPAEPVAAAEPVAIEPPVAPENASIQQSQISISWQTFLGLGWLIAVLIMLGLLVQRVFFVNSLIRQSKPAAEDLLSQLKRCASKMGTQRKMDLRISPNATSPSVCGLIRPVILIPDNLTDQLNAGQMDAILMHELAHIKRGDLWVNLAQALLQIIYFYNPLLWMANAVIRRTREQAVDEMVLVAMDEQAQDYPETLLNVSKLVWSKPMLSLRLIGVVESKSALTSRIKHILSRPFPKSAKIGIVGLVAIFITAAVLLPMAKGNSTKDTNNWTKPTEKWKAKPIKKTSLESFFGGWKNLPLEISADEEQAVKRCKTLLVRWDDIAANEPEKARKELEEIVSERPEFFYAEFLLGIWHRDYGDEEIGRELIRKAYDHAPVIIAQKYQDENGKPITNLEIQTYEIECNTVKKGSLSNFDLKFRDLITDDEGCIYVPVYDTVYRRSGATLPSGYNIAYPTLGWFKARSKVALMPIARNNSTDGGAYENAEGSKNYKIKVGPTKFEAHTVVRWHRDGNPVVMNPAANILVNVPFKIPDFSAQTKWMDIAQVYLSPEQTVYDVVELRVFDHAQRKLLSMEDYPGIGYCIEDSVVTVYSTGKMLPDSLDIWMRVLHRGAKHYYILEAHKQAGVDIDGNALRILDIAKGQYNWANGKRGKHHAQWDDYMTSVAMKFDKPGNEKYQICANTTDGRRIVPADPHFLRPSNGWQLIEFAVPMEKITTFVITPFEGRDRFFFDDVKLPPRSGSLDMVPALRFAVDGQEGKHIRQVDTFYTVELNILNNTEISGIESSVNGFGSTYSTKESKSLRSLVCKIEGLGVKDITFVAYDKQGKLLDLSKRRGSGHTRSSENTVYYIETKTPVEEIHTIDVYLEKIDDPQIPARINSGQPTLNPASSEAEGSEPPTTNSQNYTATLPNGVAVEKDKASESAAIAILEKVIAKYESLESYSSEGEIVTDIDMSGFDGDVPGLSDEASKEAHENKAFQDALKVRHNFTHHFNIKLTRDDYFIGWDQKVHAKFSNIGATWSEGDEDFVVVAEQKKRVENRQMALALATGVSGGAASTVPSLFFGDPSNSLSEIKEAKIESEGVLDGIGCYILTGKQTGYTIKYWVGRNDYLIRRKQHIFEGNQEVPKMSEEQMEASRGNESDEEWERKKESMRNALILSSKIKGSTTETHRNIVINKPIDMKPYISKYEDIEVAKPVVQTCEPAFDPNAEDQKTLTGKVGKPDELSGRVIDENGNPLQGVLVDVWTWYPRNETTTDSQGNFYLDGFDPDQKTVEVRFSKDGYSPRYIIKQPLGVKDTTVILNNKTYFEGTVLDAEGSPVANALVRAVAGPKRAEGVMITEVTTETKSNDAGNYRLYVQADTYDIRVNSDKGVLRLSNVIIAKDQSKTLDLNLASSVTFKAKVIDSETGQPVQGLRLYKWKQKSIDATSDPNGYIEIAGMLPGKFEFWVESKQCGRWWSEQCLSQWSRYQIDDEETSWQRNFDGLDFELSIGMEPVTIIAEKPVIIRGKVLDPNGKPVAGATATLARTGSGNSITGDTRYSFQTNSEGHFEMLVPASNDAQYNLIAHDGKYNQWRNWANGVQSPIKTTPGQIIEDVILKLSRPATVKGKVFDENGNLAVNHQVRAHAFDKLGNRTVILKFSNRTIVVTPDNPEEFVKRIKKFRNL